MKERIIENSNQIMVQFCDKIKGFDEQFISITNGKADKTTTNNIQQQVNNLVLGAVGNGNNAEVVQARGSYDTLNSRLNDDEKISQNIINSIITNKFKYNLQFKNASIDSNGVEHDFYKDIRLSTIDFFNGIKGSTLHSANGYDFKVYVYDTNHSFLSVSDWTNNFYLDENKIVKIVLRKSNDTNIYVKESNNFEVIYEIVADNAEHETIVKSVREQFTNLDEILKTGGYSIPKTVDLEQGTLTGSDLSPSDIKLRSINYLGVEDFKGVTFSPSEGYKFFLRGFDKNNIVVGGSSGEGYFDWNTNNFTFNGFSNVNIVKFKILLSKIDDSVIDISSKHNLKTFKFIDQSYDFAYKSKNGSIKKISDLETEQTFKYKNNLYKTSINQNLDLFVEKDSTDNILKDRVLIWQDDFDGNKLDENKWEAQFGYYNGDRYYMYKDTSKNAYCENSCLVITNLKDYPNEKCNWSGAFVKTKNKFEFRYGRVEAKIKFPSSSIYHSTFWTLGSNYDKICNENNRGDETIGVLSSTCGEFDIAECDNREVTNNIHYSSDTNNTHASAGGSGYGVDATQWHIYAMEWTENKVEFFVDGTLKRSWDLNNATVGDYNPFKLPHFLMFNSNPGLTQLNSTDDEIINLCDWVRVYAPIGIKEYIYETDITLSESSTSLNVGETKLLKTNFTPSNASDMTLIWESFNENVAKCHGGKITAIGQGTTFVRVTSKHGIRKMCKVVVN